VATVPTVARALILMVATPVAIATEETTHE